MGVCPASTTNNLEEAGWFYYVIGWHQDDLAEYLMEFGGEYSRLIVRGLADRPGPVRFEIYIDGEVDVANLEPPQLALKGNNNGPVSFDGVIWYVEPFHGNHTSRLDEIRIGRSLEEVTPGLSG